MAKIVLIFGVLLLIVAINQAHLHSFNELIKGVECTPERYYYLTLWANRLCPLGYDKWNLVKTCCAYLACGEAQVEAFCLPPINQQLLAKKLEDNHWCGVAYRNHLNDLCEFPISYECFNNYADQCCHEGCSDEILKTCCLPEKSNNVLLTITG